MLKIIVLLSAYVIAAIGLVQSNLAQDANRSILGFTPIGSFLVSVSFIGFVSAIVQEIRDKRSARANQAELHTTRMLVAQVQRTVNEIQRSTTDENIRKPLKDLSDDTFSYLVSSLFNDDGDISSWALVEMQDRLFVSDSDIAEVLVQARNQCNKKRGLVNALKYLNSFDWSSHPWNTRQKGLFKELLSLIDLNARDIAPQVATLRQSVFGSDIDDRLDK